MNTGNELAPTTQLAYDHDNAQNSAGVHNEEVEGVGSGNSLHAACQSVNDEDNCEDDAGDVEVETENGNAELTGSDHLGKTDSQHNEDQQSGGNGASLLAEELLDDAGNGNRVNAAVELCKAETQEHGADCVCNGVPGAGETVVEAVLGNAGGCSAAEPLTGRSANDSQKAHLCTDEGVGALALAAGENTDKNGGGEADDNDYKLNGNHFNQILFLFAIIFIYLVPSTNKGYRAQRSVPLGHRWSLTKGCCPEAVSELLGRCFGLAAECGQSAGAPVNPSVSAIAEPPPFTQGRL